MNLEDKIKDAARRCLSNYLDSVEEGAFYQVQSLELVDTVFDAPKVSSVAAALSAGDRQRTEMQFGGTVNIVHIFGDEFLQHTHYALFVCSLTLHEGDNVAADLIQFPKDWEEAWRELAAKLRAQWWSVVGRQLAALGLTEGSEKYKRASLILAAEDFGPAPERLVFVSGYEPKFIEEVATRMRAAALWRHDSVDTVHQPGRNSNVMLALHLSVAEGKLLRIWSAKENNYVYEVRE